jgi:hypothetical protein
LSGIQSSFRANGIPTDNGNSRGFHVASVPIVTSDYNGDGVVDAADYAVRRDTLGQTGIGLAAVGDGNDIVDVGDYDNWKNHFGHTAGGAGATLRR